MHISAYLRYIHDPSDAMTHIWNRYDTIIDEVHSLITDSTYQSTTFDVLSLIYEYLTLYKNNQLQECACKHLILMTGTPQPFETYVQLNFPEELTNTIELFDRCENVVPKKILLIDEQSSKAKIRDLLTAGNKVVYFTNRTLTETAARKKFGLPSSINIGVSFSNEEKRNKLAETELIKMENIEKNLANHSLIPEDIQFFITTSRNKEGININNTDYCYMFVETHLMHDIVQMSGRVRNGIDYLYIVSNAEQLSNGVNVLDVMFSKNILVANKDVLESDDATNKYLLQNYLIDAKTSNSLCTRTRALIKHYVKYIESRFAYVRYNVFKEHFEFFEVKEFAEMMEESQTKCFDNMIVSGNIDLVREWFPKSEIIYEISAKEHAIVYLNNVIGKNNYTIISKEDRDSLTKKLQELLSSNLTSLNSLLKSVNENYTCKQSGKNYILFYGNEDPRTKKKPMGRHKNTRKSL